ncbi:hypothetical protein ABFS82_13G181700 [Erythranthe guttata]
MFWILCKLQLLAAQARVNIDGLLHSFIRAFLVMKFEGLGMETSI